ncbi:MAG TPA: STAS domain-containing protein [Planctomycetaceae bacterium]|nr:STAS domain-containing protein [Planctomycetaceae bacterium]
MPEPALTQIHKINEITVVEFGPRCKHIDEPVVELTSREVMDAVATASPPKVALDLSHTEFFGSSFIEVLFRAWNRLQHKPGGQMALIGLAPYCREVLEITHLDKLWPIYDTRDAAIQAMKSA